MRMHVQCRSTMIRTRKTPWLTAVLCAALSLTTSGIATADDDDETEDDSFLSRLYVRNVGFLHLSPALATSDEVVLSGVVGPASLAVDNGPIAGSGTDMSSVTLPGLSVGYVLKRFGNKTLSIETVAAPPPVTIKLKATGTLANESLAPEALGIPTGVPPLGEELGEAEALPPIVTGVVRFMTDKRVRPYAGGGLSYLIITDARITNDVLSPTINGMRVEPKLDIEHGFGNLGVVLQGGAEVVVANVLGKEILLNLDVKFIAKLNLKATVLNAYVATPGLPLFEYVAVGNAEASVTVNPLIIQGGVGVNF